MKKPVSYFDNLEELVSFSYQNFGNSLQYYVREFKVDSPLGYCYKYSSPGVTIYNVVTSPIGKPHTDRRIKAHELGHITLGHLSGVHEELDSRVLWTINNDRANLIEGINKSLGIDYADKLLNRVIDDPQLNHSLHNIAMDFEVNQQILSSEDVEEMENDISEFLLSIDPLYQSLKNVDKDSLTEEQKKALEDIQKQMASSKIKLMLPERYHLSDGSPFPTDLTYPEYLILIIKNLSEFVKMLVSIKNGGSGDTSEVTEEQLKEALSGGDPGQGGSGGMTSLDDLLDACGMSPGQGNPGDKYKGCREDPNQSQSGKSFDHGSESRDEADKSREKGQISAKPGTGCGSSGGASGSLDASQGPKDPVTMAIDEVIRGFKSKVCSFVIKKDMTYLYNRGINRAVIAPVYHTKATVTTEPKIVYLIDVSGSMDSDLVSRILNTIAAKMKSIKKGLKYDVIAWSTQLCDHLKDIDPRKPVPRISIGGGTRMARGIKYFKDNYDKSCTLVLISDFEDYLDEWEQVTSEMTGYDLYGFCYGYRECTRKIKNFKIKNFTNDY
ncbi:MAG: VWA domain-containing protein [Muribaculaceae bacterium]|nr:VWA domain-containing protein [Muribaculaceae bacterium]